MKLLILAAGYAIRLHPLTIHTPKPLLSLGKKTILDSILDKTAVVKGVDGVYLVTNDKFYPAFEKWRQTSPYKQITVVVNDGTLSNETRLGAIKDIRFTIEKMAIDDDLLIVAGDNIFDFDVESFIHFAKSKGDGIAVALYDVGSIEAAKKYGVVAIDSDSIVTGFEEKPASPRSTLVSTGIYYLPKNKTISIAEYLSGSDMKADQPGYYVSWVSMREKVYGFTFSGDWYDIGDIDTYQKACRKYSY